MTEHGVSICDGGIQSAAVTNWSGHGAGTLWADTQGTALIETRDGTAPGADSMNFKHGHGDGKSRNDGLAGGAQFAGEQRHIRGVAANVKADELGDAVQFGE